MSSNDPFAEKHRSDEQAADKAQKGANQKAAAAQIQQRMAAKTAAAARPANWDIGYPFPRKFYDPKA